MHSRETDLPAINYAVDTCEKVNINLVTGCWFWTGPRVSDVPFTGENGGKRVARYFVEKAYGKRIPSHARFSRSCGGDCVNPAHLVLRPGG